MQKVILDTNIVVSALIQKSFPYLILQELYLEKAIQAGGQSTPDGARF